MIFLKTKKPNYGDYAGNMTRVEINTLSEIEAFARAGCGRADYYNVHISINPLKVEKLDGSD